MNNYVQGLGLVKRCNCPSSIFDPKEHDVYRGKGGGIKEVGDSCP